MAAGVGGSETVLPGGVGDAGSFDQETAFETAYTGRRRELMRMVMSGGLSLAEAEDVIHDVFLRALYQLRERKTPANLFGWLLTATRNAVIDRFRQRRHEVGASVEQWYDLDHRVPDRATGPDRSLLEQERLRHLRRAVAALPETERRCLLLRSRGAKYREIAELLGIPLRTAAYHTSCAIEKIQRRVGP